MADIFLYGPITSFENSATEVKDQLKGIPQSETINVRINSPGGNVFDGFAIASLLRSIPNRTVSYIDGIAASMAAYIAVSTDETFISQEGKMMIHFSSTVAEGNRDDMERTMKLLKSIDESATTLFRQKAGGRKRDIEKMLKEETWLSADEAIDIGFADGKFDSLPIAAFSKINNIKMNSLEKIKAFANSFIFGSKEYLEALPEEAQEELRKIVTESQEETKAKLEEDLAKAEGTGDIVNVGLAKEGDVNLKFTLLEKAFTSLLTLQEDQPTKEEIEAKIKEEVEAGITSILKSWKTNVQVQAPSNSYNVTHREQKPKQTLSPAQMEEINKKRIKENG